MHINHRRSYNHHNAKLTPSGVAHIRAARGIERARALATLYGISTQTVHQIWMGRTYKEDAHGLRVAAEEGSVRSSVQGTPTTGERKHMPKKVLVALPPGLLEQIDVVASTEHRTRSDLVREALRRYIDIFKRTQGPRLAISTVGTQKVALRTEAEVLAANG